MRRSLRCGETEEDKIRALDYLFVGMGSLSLVNIKDSHITESLVGVCNSGPHNTITNDPDTVYPVLRSHRTSPDGTVRLRVRIEHWSQPFRGGMRERLSGFP